MGWMGQIIGVIIGYLVGGFFGAMIGGLIGYLFDSGILHRWKQGAVGGGRHHGDVQRIFFNTTFQVMGKIAKSDGRVSESELEVARQVMNQMLLNQQLKTQAMHLFNEGKQSHFNLDAALEKLRTACYHHPSLLRVFIEMQLQMALAETGEISGAKRQILQAICDKLGIHGINFSQFEQRARAEQHYYQHRREAQQNPHAYLDDAYRILGVNASMGDAQVVKAYRRLMSQNHPDKLMAKGLPPEMLKVATRKTQQIKEAYEQIKKARGMR